MNAFTVVHIGLAAICGLMAMVHVGMWLAVRSEPAHRWVAFSFLGFTLTELGLAGSSSASNGSLGAPQPWMLASVPTVLLLVPVLARTAWAVLDWPMTRARWGLLGVFLLLTTPVAVQLVWFAMTDDPRGQTWETARYAIPATSIPYNIALTGLAALWLIEAGRALESNRGLALAAIGAAIPAILISLREVLMARGFVDGPSLVGISGLPLIGFASVSLVVRYVRALRSAALVAVDHTETPPPDAYRRMVRLGKGGMGEAWLALRSSEGGFRRWVVVKQIRLDRLDDEILERFLVEARVAARLHHPNIVSVYDLLQTETGWAIVMEYLAGPSLWDVLTRNYEEEAFAPLQLVASVVEQLCRGLECAHSHGVLHRDISPDNILLTFDGQAKLLDFGIAKETGANVRDLSPRDGQAGTTLGSGIVGKSQYMAPERTVGEPAGPESDIYSVGLVLVQLLGAPLTPRGADMAGKPNPISAHRPDVPEELEDIVRRALAPHPKQRFRSAAAMANELRGFAADLEHIDMGAWLRRLCPQKWKLDQELQTLREPTKEAVNDLFADTYPATDAPLPAHRATREADPGPTAGPVPTTLDD